MNNPKSFKPSRFDSIRSAFSNVYDWYDEADSYFSDVVPSNKWDLNLLDNEFAYNTDRFGNFRYKYDDSGEYPWHFINWSRPIGKRK